MYNPSIAIIGAGRAGTALGDALASKGCRICGVASRSLVSAKKLADRYQAAASIKPQQVTVKAQVIFITTPDDFIAETARQTAEAGGFKKGQFVYHSSGALGAEVLATVKRCGAFVGCMHPLQTLAGNPVNQDLLLNCYFALAGDGEAVEMAQRLVQLIGGISLNVPAESRALYHAAASVASNYLVALLHAAGHMLKEAGVNDGAKVLMPLVAGTLNNIETQGTIAALTGPISRGDTKTVAKHFTALQGTDEADLYAALARYTTQIAVEKGTLDTNKAAEIIKLAK
ncbi:MAG: DUF2520 domain-containing protein [Pelosinus sp.]|nr:DUF2520 domain-containing protein [Pelosinus sp.]